MIIAAGLTCIIVYMGVITISTANCDATEYNRDPFSCVSCDSEKEAYCDDPFNLSQVDYPIEECNDLCVKWVKKSSRDGRMMIRRTCSKSFKIKMRKTAVCMWEATADGGHICFCRGDRCNSAPLARLGVTFLRLFTSSVFTAHWFTFVASLLASVTLSQRGHW